MKKFYISSDNHYVDVYENDLACLEKSALAIHQEIKNNEKQLKVFDK